jgi:hypothetical protein
MTAPERFADRSDSSCTAGAVHTWPYAAPAFFVVGIVAEFSWQANLAGYQPGRNVYLVHRFDEIDHMGVGFIFAETTCSLTA